MGDSIQFARYVPLVAAKGARVVLECQAPLVALFESLEGAAEIVARDAPLPAFDVQAPLLSLPRIFKTELDSIPESGAYLAAEVVRSKKFTDALDPGRLNVGIAWAGKPSHRNDRNRSAGIEPFIDLLGTPGATFHSLQVGPRAGDIAATGCAGLIRDHAPDLQDFADTAALVSALDLVISVDTSVCHLAGALGKPCWVVIPYTPDWRWLMQREDSPWYPSLRLFRQERFGDWPGVFERLSQAQSQPSLRYVLIHGVNPFGFSNLRRCNEDNVDVNRNFLESGDDYMGAPDGYAGLDSFLNPESPPS